MEEKTEWKWYNIDNLPEPLFEMCKLAIKAYKENKNYFDIIKIKK